MKNLNILAIIPARAGSKGLPKKNIINFCGKPLVSWSIEQALGSKYVKNVYVTSDSEDILKISEVSGAMIIKRPKKMAIDTSPIEEALMHAINYIKELNKKKIDIIVFLQPTSPLRTSKDIDGAIKFFIASKADSLFAGAILEDLCAWERRKNKLKSLTFDYKNRRRRQERKPYYLESGSIYVFRPNVIKRYKNRLGGKIEFYPMPFWKSYEIDKIEDVEICEYYMRKKILKKEE